MNFGKLQLSFMLLLIMTVIHLITAIFIVKKVWLICSSLVAMSLCVIGLIYALRKEAESNKQKHQK